LIFALFNAAEEQEKNSQGNRNTFVTPY